MGEIYIRGAVTSENTKESIFENTKELLLSIMEQNSLTEGNVLEITFSATRDLDAAYPAEAARTLGFASAALFCVQEMYVKNSMKKCIRVKLAAKSGKEQSDVKHVYLKGARLLRPDLDKAPFSIAIDGPAGSGKSTAAKAVAKKLGITYIDTGAMYRAVALYCNENGISTTDEAEVAKILEDINIDLSYENEALNIYLNGKNVTNEIRTQKIGQGASDVGVFVPVRDHLVKIQQRLAKGKSVIMDGRDICTVVLPDAEVKIFITAGVRERAMRRLNELALLGKSGDLETIIREIEARDINDSTRKYNPLRKTDDAVLLDTSDMTIDEVVQKILDITAERI